MTDLFLILHKVRGAPVFDIAARMECPSCEGAGQMLGLGDADPDTGIGPDCIECDEQGFWWIIPTSGHRAYPYWCISLNDLIPTKLIAERLDYDLPDTIGEAFANGRLPMPDNLPDHYPTSAAPKVDLTSVIAALSPKVERRM